MQRNRVKTAKLKPETACFVQKNEYKSYDFKFTVINNKNSKSSHVKSRYKRISGYLCLESMHFLSNLIKSSLWL